MELSHINRQGDAVMVDVTEKDITSRMATASGIIKVNAEVMQAIKKGESKKGDILAVARIAGIMAVKHTPDIIPLCHQLPISKCTVEFIINEDECCLKAVCTVKVTACTGVEMEAITGVCAALCTVYDMCKAIDKGMVISEVHLEHKEGGRSGIFDFANGERL